jgi:hypothetical protein
MPKISSCAAVFCWLFVIDKNNIQKKGPTIEDPAITVDDFD